MDNNLVYGKNVTQILQEYNAILEDDANYANGLPVDILRGVINALMRHESVEHFRQDKRANEQHMDPIYFESVCWVWNNALVALLQDMAREAAKALIRPYVLNPRYCLILPTFQMRLTTSGPAYHASIGPSAFAEGNISHPFLLALPLDKIGVYRVGKTRCEEVFDLAEIYSEVYQEVPIQVEALSL